MDLARIVEKGIDIYRLGKFEEAIETFMQALEISPTNTSVLSNIGSCYLSLGENDLAIEYLEKALEVDPKFMQANYNLANVYFNMGNFYKAAKHYENISDNGSRNPEIFLNLATSYAQINENKQAEKYFKYYIAIKDDDSDAFSNLGVALSRLGKFEEAIENYKKALKIDSTKWDTHYNLGILYARQKDFENAVDQFEKLVKLNPTHSRALSHLVNRSPYILDWQRWQKYSPLLDKITNEELQKNIVPGEQPFMSVIRKDDPKINLQIAKSYSDEMDKKAKLFEISIDYKNLKKSSKKIRIGYVSDGFRDFPTGHNIARIIELHDKNSFEIIVYSHGPIDDSVWFNRIKQAVDRFEDIRDLPDHEAAKKIKQDNIDILIDLKGHTKDTRLPIFSFKPAKLQVSWLGFPGSTGASFIDYAIVDETVIPKEEKNTWSEKLIYMPHTYRSTDDQAPTSVIPFEREDFNLPSDKIVFASFNSPYKVDPLMLNTWTNILKKVPNSVLWQLEDTADIKRRFLTEIEKRGVEKTRVIFAEKIIKESHLARLKLADIALDTRIVNGHTTTVDSLWAGIPVITLCGKHFCSRVSASVLKAIELPELITESLEEYEKLATRIAKSKSELANTKQKLSNNIKTTALFDSNKFTKNIEKAYKQIYKRSKSNKKPTDIYIQ